MPGQTLMSLNWTDMLDSVLCVQDASERTVCMFSQASAVPHGTVIGRLLSKLKMHFSTSRPGKTNEYFETKLGRRDYVGKIYKLTKFAADRLRNDSATWC